MSLSFTGSFDISANAAFNFGSNEFTIEWWQYGMNSTATGDRNLITFDDNNSFTIIRAGPATLSWLNVDGIIDGKPGNIGGAVNFNNNKKWAHLVVSRRNNIDDGTGVKVDRLVIFVNGTVTDNITIDIHDNHYAFNNATKITIGDSLYPAPFELLYNFCVLLGTAKYTGTFIPSTVAPLQEAYNYNLILYVVYGYDGNLELRCKGTGLNKRTKITTSAPTTLSTTVPPSAIIPIGTICFVAGTPVLTDNYGYVPINQLIPGKHTINNYKILTVTESVTPENKLAVIPAGSLCAGVPSADTIMSLNHRIKINGEWIKSFYVAKKLGRTFIKYNGGTLYNILLGDSEGRPCSAEMIVNNMIVETLDPDNIIAKVYLSSEENRVKIISALNEKLNYSK
jgi:hypothetical protein